MAAASEIVIFGKQADIAVTAIVATANDGYFVKVPNAFAGEYTHVGLSLYSAGLTADGVDSVLWAQAWALDHEMNLAVNIDDAASKGAIGIHTKLQAGAPDYDGWEFITSGGAGSITVNCVMHLISHAYTVSGKCIVPNFALMLRANTGANSWTAGTLSVKPFGFR